MLCRTLVAALLIVLVLMCYVSNASVCGTFLHTQASCLVLHDYDIGWCDGAGGHVVDVY